MPSSVYVPQNELALSEIATSGMDSMGEDMKAFNTTPELPLEYSTDD